MSRLHPIAIRTKTILPYTTLFPPLRGCHAVSRSILRPAAHRAERRAGDVGARPGVVAAQPARPVGRTGQRRGPDCPAPDGRPRRLPDDGRSEEHTSELQSLMRISYAVFCLKKKNNTKIEIDKDTIT